MFWRSENLHQHTEKQEHSAFLLQLKEPKQIKAGPDLTLKI